MSFPSRSLPSAAMAATCLAALLAAPVLAQQVYSWKDAKGVTHYSDSPPPKGTQARTVPVPPPPPPAPVAKAQVEPAPASTAAARPAAQAPDPALVQALAEQRAVQCKQAQDNLKVLQTNAAVAVDNDGDGRNDAVIDQAERDKQTATMQAAIQANCIQ